MRRPLIRAVPRSASTASRFSLNSAVNRLGCRGESGGLSTSMERSQTRFLPLLVCHCRSENHPARLAVHSDDQRSSTRGELSCLQKRLASIECDYPQSAVFVGAGTEAHGAGTT